MTVTNKQIAKAFKEAKKYLATNIDDYYRVRGRKERFICLAIEFHEPDIKVGKKAMQIIEERLGYYSTVEDWLVQNNFLSVEELVKGTKKTANKIQKYRHAWLDSLIKEFSDKKD